MVRRSHQIQARLITYGQIGPCPPQLRTAGYELATKSGLAAANWATVSSLAASSSSMLVSLRTSTLPTPGTDLLLNLPALVLSVTRSLGLMPFMAKTQSSSEMPPESTVMVEPSALMRPGSLVGDERPSSMA